jgi:hypothetical protein
MARKLSVLRACRSAMKPGGRMGFFTIFVADGLPERDYQRALRSGPSFVSSRRRDHKEMLGGAGFASVKEIDLTAEFLETTRAWLNGRERYREELIAVEGEASFEERQNDSRLQAKGIEDGLLRRALFVCESAESERFRR